jgi:sugar lactone lactonase YvrE
MDVRVVRTGILMGESPRWHDGRVWFSDWMAQQVIAVDADGTGEVVAAPPSLPACIEFLPDGRLLVVSGGDGRLLRREADGTLVTHADLSHLSPYPWNDIVRDGRGNVFVNNINFEFPDGEPKPGLVAVVTPGGEVRQVADDLQFPNGMAVTPDGATLIVAESYGNRLTAYDIGADGSLSGRRTWADLDGGYPDGICLDAEGAAWYADVPNRRCVRVREGGEVLDTVDLDRGAFACVLGGPDRRTLYIVAADFERLGQGEPTGQLLAVPVRVAGAGRP